MEEKARLTSVVKAFEDCTVRMDVWQDEEGAPYSIIQIFGFGKQLFYHDTRLNEICPLDKIAWNEVLEKMPHPASDDDFYELAQKAIEELDLPLLEAVACGFPELRRATVLSLDLDWLIEDFGVVGLQSLTAVKDLAEDLYHNVAEDIESRLLHKDLINPNDFILDDPDQFGSDHFKE